jgi:hypothetical protein
MRRIAVLSGLVLVGGLLGPSTAFAGEEDGHGTDNAQWIAVEDQFALVLPDGETFTGEGDPGPLDPNDVPSVGTQLFVSEVLYETEDGETRGDEVGRSHIQCTAQVGEFISSVTARSSSTSGPDFSPPSPSTSAWKKAWRPSKSP